MDLLKIALLFGISISSYAQTFEGKIIYKNSYQSKIPNISSEELDVMMGTDYEYYIKGNRYKSVTNGNFTQWQLYVPTKNRLYAKTAMSDTLLWFDGSSNTDKVISYEIKKDQAEILGYKCDALIMQTSNGKTTYYFNGEIKVDPEVYKNHKYGNWAFFVNTTKSLPLKIETESQQFNLVSEAIKIEEMKLSDDLFTLPDVPIKKSPY